MLHVIPGRGAAEAEKQPPHWLIPPAPLATSTAPSLHAAPLAAGTAARLSQVFGLNRVIVNERCPAVLRRAVAGHLLLRQGRARATACTIASCPSRWAWLAEDGYDERHGVA